MYYQRGKKADFNILWPIVFALISAGVGILTWATWYSVFIFTGLIVNTVCMSFKEPQNVRKSILVSSPLVLTYDVFVMSIGGAIYETVVIISSIIGIIRYKNKTVDIFY